MSEKTKEHEEYVLTPAETYTNASSLLNLLGSRTSKILINFALNECKKIKQSSMNENTKKEMYIQLHEAITVETLRMKKSKIESERIFG